MAPAGGQDAVPEKTANDFAGATDNETLERAIACRNGRPVIIPKRVSRTDPARDWWLLDRAIRVPSDTTLIIRDCRIKLSDACRDNFIRSANCGLGIAENPPVTNVHIVGEGRAVLEGADHPRATGDGSKVIRRTSPHDRADWLKHAYWLDAAHFPSAKIHHEIHQSSYGTDSGKEGESQFGDWRDIGILFANVAGFSIRNLTMRDTHGWAISLEACSDGEIGGIAFDMRMCKMIDGMKENIENQDGIDLRAGCHDILVHDITGRTGDDVVALTTLAGGPLRAGGAMKWTEVMHSDWARRPAAISNVVIRNVRAQSYGGCCVVRLLPVETTIRHVVISNVVDTFSLAECPDRWGPTIMLGGGGYGRNLPDGLRDITIANVQSGDAPVPICAGGILSDSVITDVTSATSRTCVSAAPGNLKNVRQSGFRCLSE